MSNETLSKMPVEQPPLVLLGAGTGRNHAEEAQSLGLKVGDIIRGTERGSQGGGWWHEARLTVLWMGASVVVYRKQWRANHSPDFWFSDGEVASFTLSCRQWFSEQNSVFSERKVDTFGEGGKINLRDPLRNH